MSNELSLVNPPIHPADGIGPLHRKRNKIDIEPIKTNEVGIKLKAQNLTKFWKRIINNSENIRSSGGNGYKTEINKIAFHVISGFTNVMTPSLDLNTWIRLS